MEVQIRRHGGVAVRHLKDVEAELARMKRIYAELALDHHALKDVQSRKG